MASGSGSGAGGNAAWSLVWLLILFFIAFPVAGFCAGWYILILPLTVCIDGLTVSTEYSAPHLKTTYFKVHGQFS